MDDEALLIEVRGPGHHDRAEAAARLIAELTELGRVVVETTLRPRLAADVEALLASGAEAVVLEGPASSGEFRSSVTRHGEASTEEVEVIVRLVADQTPLNAMVRTGADTPRGEAATGMIGRLGLSPA